MSTESTSLGLIVNEPPQDPVRTGGAICDQVQPADDFMARYRSFTDSLSMRYRRQAEALGFVVNPREVPANPPSMLPHRCYELTRADSYFRRLILESDMFTFLETWADALAYVRETSLWCSGL